jgi:hypothetical protein
MMVLQVLKAQLGQEAEPRVLLDLLVLRELQVPVVEPQALPVAQVPQAQQVPQARMEIPGQPEVLAQPEAPVQMESLVRQVIQAQLVHKVQLALASRDLLVLLVRKVLLGLQVTMEPPVHKVLQVLASLAQRALRAMMALLVLKAQLGQEAEPRVLLDLLVLRELQVPVVEPQALPVAQVSQARMEIPEQPEVRALQVAQVQLVLQVHKV